MQDLRCPKGCARLERHQTPHGMMWICPGCKGRAVGLAVLRKSVEPKLVTSLWTMAREGQGQRGPACVHCLKSMEQVTLALGEPGEGEEIPELELDICVSCHFLWFDPGELDAMPEKAAAPAVEEERELPPEAVELWARMRAGQAARSVEASLHKAQPLLSKYGEFSGHTGSDLVSVVTWGLFS